MQNTNHKIVAAVQRLEAITWQYDPRRTPSHVALVQEYFRRTALCFDVLPLDAHRAGPFRDLPTLLVPGIDIPQETIQRILNPERMNRLMHQLCIFYLHWVAIEDNPRVTQLRLDAPYEPIIRMFERGGHIRTAGDFIDVDGAGILKHNWYSRAKHQEPIALDDASLDQIDHLDQVRQESLQRRPWWGRVWQR